MSTQQSIFEEHGADFSGDRKYRYRLWREWSVKPLLTFIMLNPSVANESDDDRTVRKCMNIAKLNGYGGVDICNLYAYITPNPEDLTKIEDPVGPDNDYYLNRLLTSNATLILAWGNQVLNNDRILWLAERIRVLSNMDLMKPNINCLGINQTGHPRHPLYLPNDTKIISYEISFNLFKRK